MPNAVVTRFDRTFSQLNADDNPKRVRKQRCISVTAGLAPVGR
jgi:hypothetical protein